MSQWLSDTIAAIATAPGEAGLCIVRMSGPDALKIADKVFSGHSQPSIFQSHTVHYGYIVDSVSKDQVDEVLITVMHKPRTYTCEDVVEISGHGGIRPGTRILEAVIAAGARLAGPGEFTKRAFLNGRMDLLQAEAVAEIIRGQTDAAQRAGLRQLNGDFSLAINEYRSKYLELLSLIEVGIDFTEEDIPELEYSHFLFLATPLHQSLHEFTSDARCWRTLKEGLRLLLIGRPNVGKSSLLNRFVNHERAIVDPTPGTTRDTIEETIDFNGIPVSLIDTAGIRSSGRSIESQGVERTLREAETCDLFLWVLDGSRQLQSEDDHVYHHLDVEKTLGVLNKSDIDSVLNKDLLAQYNIKEWVQISALTGEGFLTLKETLFKKIVGAHDIYESQGVVNIRQLECLDKALAHSKQMLHLLNNGYEHEIISIEVKDVVSQLDQILGLEIGDDLLDHIFSSFCIGK